MLFNNTEEEFSGGTNIQLNSNDASPTETTLTQYRPYWLKTFYEQNEMDKFVEPDIVYIPDKEKTDIYGNYYKDITENFCCGRNKNKIYDINDYIVTNDDEQLKL